jgi:hypothetical protein
VPGVASTLVLAGMAGAEVIPILSVVTFPGYHAGGGLYLTLLDTRHILSRMFHLTGAAFTPIRPFKRF